MLTNGSIIKSIELFPFRAAILYHNYVISSFEPFPSDFTGGLRFLSLRFPDLENEDPGQTFG